MHSIISQMKLLGFCQRVCGLLLFTVDWKLLLVLHAEEFEYLKKVIAKMFPTEKSYLAGYYLPSGKGNAVPSGRLYRDYTFQRGLMRHWDMDWLRKLKVDALHRLRQIPKNQLWRTKRKQRKQNFTPKSSHRKKYARLGKNHLNAAEISSLLKKWTLLLTIETRVMSSAYMDLYSVLKSGNSKTLVSTFIRF